MKITTLQGTLRSAYVLAHKLVKYRHMGTTSDDTTDIKAKVRDYLSENGLKFNDSKTEEILVSLAEMNVRNKFALPNPQLNNYILGTLLKIKLD